MYDCLMFQVLKVVTWLQGKVLSYSKHKPIFSLTHDTALQSLIKTDQL